MSDRPVRRHATAVALVLATVTTTLLAVSWLLAWQNSDLNVLTGQFGTGQVTATALTLVGFIVATRRPGNPIGWLFLSGSVVGSLNAASGEYAIHGLLASASVPGTAWAAWITNWITGLIFPCGILMLILLLFPNGRLVSPRWRWLLVPAALYTAFQLLLTVAPGYPILVAPNVRPIASPLAISAISSTLISNMWFIWPIGMVMLLIAGASLLVRYRRSVGEERQQIKWFVYAVSVTLLALAACMPFSFSNQYQTPISTAIIIGGFAIAMPTACAVAILRYRLYDIDVVISRTLVYGSLAALITGVYVAIAVGIGELVGSGGRPNLGLSILATAIVAVGFQPVRERLQRVADRMVYGRRATPYQVLSEFSAKVAGAYAADEVLPRMARVLQEGTSAEVATVWLRSGDVLHPAASQPDDPRGEAEAALSVNGELPVIPNVSRAVEVRSQGELLGALSVVKRRGEVLTPVEEKLLNDLAHQAGLVLKNVRLTTDLQRRLEELRLSRQRLVSAQDAERRRLERNLHDGAQQHLVALKVKLGLVEMLMARDVEKARATLAQLKDDADEALETLRDLARGIYPPLLADKGLVVALESQARKATLPVSVVAEGIGRYPQEIEAAMYFCCLEALQNTQKYANARQVTIRLGEVDDLLCVQIADDGDGFDPATIARGSGLTNMEDRLEALGGDLLLESSPGCGTSLRASLPLPVAAPA